jgi:hypothetical protein
VRPVWAGMQDASAATRVGVSYLAAEGDGSVGDVLPYLAGLLQRGCDVVTRPPALNLVRPVIRWGSRRPMVTLAGWDAW